MPRGHMSHEAEQLDDRYLEVALRDQMGPRVDLTQRVLHAVAGAAAPVAVKHRVMPLPRRRPAWQPLAAAAAVLLAAGIGVYALVQVLPQAAPIPQTSLTTPLELPSARPSSGQAGPERPAALPPAGRDQNAAPDPTPPRRDDARQQQDETAPADSVLPRPLPKTADPKPPSGTEPQPEIPEPKYPPGMTDPPEAWPGKVTQPKPPATEPAAPVKRTVLCRDFKPSRKDGIKLAQGKDWRVLAAGEDISAGDRVKVTGWADFTLVDGTLLRLDGEMVLESHDGQSGAELLDGALYADTGAALLVRHETLKAVVSGMAMLEQRLHSLEIACLHGSVTSGETTLAPGRTARLGSEGFSREKPVSFADLQRDNRFLKDSPARATLREDFNDAPGEIEGGAIVEGVLAGKGDAGTGTIVQLRKPVTLRGNEVVRLRFRVDRRAEVVLQFATAQGNYRHLEINPEPGKWQEVEIPVSAFFKATAPESRLGDGLALLRFQMHDNEIRELGVEVDWLEIVSRP